MAESQPPSPFPPFDPQRFITAATRLFQGVEPAMRAYRELLGLETASRERSIDFLAQLARSSGAHAAPFFEMVLRWGPTDTARVAAASYLASEGREDTVLEVLEGLQPPVLTLTLLAGLIDAIGTRPLTSAIVERLIAVGRRFDDQTRYTTLYLGDFGGRDVKRVIRRAIAEGLLRRDAQDAVDWPRE